MDGLHTFHKRGISKMNKAKEHREFKKSMRNFSLDFENKKDFPGSGSKHFSKKKKVDGNVAKKLLAMVTQTAKVTSAQAIMHSHSYSDVEISKNDIQNQKNCVESSELHASYAKTSVEFPTKVSNEMFTPNSNCERIKDDFDQTNGNYAVEDFRADKKKGSKNEEHQGAQNLLQKVKYASQESEMQNVNKQQNNFSNRGDRRRSSSTMENSLIEQEVDNTLSRDLKNDSLEPRKSIKELKILKPKINDQFKKNVKKHKKSEKVTLSVGKKLIKLKNKIGETANSEQMKSSEILPVSSVLIKDGHTADCSRISEKKHMSRTQNEQPYLMKNIQDISYHTLSQSINQSEEANKKFVLNFDNENVCNQQKNGVSGEWNVANFDELDINIDPSESDEHAHSLKKKYKLTDVLDSPSNINGNMFHKHEMPCEVIAENNFEKKDDIIVNPNENHHSRISKKICKKALEKEFCNSKPILVEMSGNYVVPSNPVCGQVSNLKKRNPISGFNLKADMNWRTPSSICSTEKWEVQYGNNESLANLENEISQFQNVTGNTTVMQQGMQHASNMQQSLPIETDSCVPVHQLFDISGTKVLLAIPPLASVFFRGAITAKVILGKISVFGYELSDNTSKECNIYSSSGFSLLCFQSCVEEDTFGSRKHYRKRVNKCFRNLENRSSIQEKVKDKIPDYSTLILLERACEPFISFLHKYFPSRHFPSSTTINREGYDSSGILKAVFVDPKCNERLYKQPFGWNSLAPFLLKRKKEEIRAMVFGGKGVGKSTLLRFLVNQMLPKCGEILYIDFDPGQCEFTSPGCVSAVIVKKPLLGPNFTHLTFPERMVYVGEVDVSGCSSHYLQCVQNVFDWCCSEPRLTKLPWIINTMGYVTGLGLHITIAIIKMVNPSDVVQIDSVTENRNYEFPLKHDKVQSHESCLPSPAGNKEATLNYTFYMLPSAAETPDNRKNPWGLNRVIARESVLLSYFSQVVAAPAFSLLEVVPSILPFAGLKLCIGREKLKYSDYLSAMNGNLVALCNADNIDSLKPSNKEYPEIIEKIPICQCFGFGIVRGIDLQKKLFFIITPVSSNKIKLINCLVLGSVHLPNYVYTSQDEASGILPYVIGGALLPLGRGVKERNSVWKVDLK